MDTTLKNSMRMIATPEGEVVRSDVMIGSTLVIRSAEQEHREELFMQRSRARRLVRGLREQLGRARRRRSKATPVPLDALEDLLRRVEEADT
jgi:hypothetical protein